MITMASSVRAIAPVLLLCLASASTAVHAGEREISEVLPGTGINSVRLHAGNGSARVEATDTDQIRISVTLSPKRYDSGSWKSFKEWFLKSKYEEVEELLSAIAIDLDEKSDRLTISLSPDGSTRTDRIKEVWVVEVPRRVHFELDMITSDVEVRNVEGGVDLDVTVGDIHAFVQGGDVEISLVVGDVDVVTKSESLGDLRLASQVGKTRLWMNGLRFKYEDPPGAGSRVRVSGKGKDSIDVKVQVGNADLKVNEGDFGD